MSTIVNAGPRRTPRAAAFLIAAAAVVAGSYLASATRTPPAADHRPPATGASLAPTTIDAGGVPPLTLAQVDHSIDAWTRNLAANSHDYLAATNLAILYQGRGRLSYDLSDYQRSLDAAREALEIEPGHTPARIAEASTLVSLHDFDGALTAIAPTLETDPGLPAALAVRFDAELELGRLPEARADITALEAVGGPAVLLRQARLASLTGDADRALELATSARSAALQDEVLDVGIYSGAVGEYARLAGDAGTSRAAFAAALELRPDDVGALIGLARIDAFEGETAAAIEGLRRATAIAPQPEALALLGDLLVTGDGDDPEAKKAFETIRFIRALGDVQAATFDRQLLRFEVDHGGATDALLGQIRASVDARPDASGQDLLAWALYRLGRYDDAATAVAAARSLGADDARLRFHDGAIRVALGDRDEGRRMLEAAARQGPALDPVERAEVARLLAA